MGVRLNPSEKKMVEKFTSMVIKARPKEDKAKKSAPKAKGKVPPQLAAYAKTKAKKKA